MNNELIADKLEEVIGRMLTHFKTLNPKPSEYSILYNPQKHASWFILIFFADINQLRDGLKSGACYQIHSFMLDELSKIGEISDVDRSIFFESGNRPNEKADIVNLYGKLLDKLEGLSKTTDKANIKTCGGCGHNFDEHQLLCFRIDETTPPTDGWMMCPEENCNCFLTWGANYKGGLAG